MSKTEKYLKVAGDNLVLLLGSQGLRQIDLSCVMSSTRYGQLATVDLLSILFSDSGFIANGENIPDFSRDGCFRFSLVAASFGL